MNKPGIIEGIAEKLSLEKTNVERVITAFEELIIEQLKKGEEVALTGFGTFSAKHRAARMGVNPQNPTVKIEIKAVTVPKFKAGKTLKDSLKK